MVRDAHDPRSPQPSLVRRGRAAAQAPPLYRAFTWAEKVVKRELFGCRMCGQCALPVPRLRLPDDLPQAASQRAVRRRQPRWRHLRGLSRHALCLADRLRARRRRRAASAISAACSARSTSANGARAPGSTTGSATTRACGPTMTPSSRPNAADGDTRPAKRVSRGVRRRLRVTSPHSHCRPAPARPFAVTAEIGPPRGSSTAEPSAARPGCCATGSTPPTSPTTRAPSCASASLGRSSVAPRCRKASSPSCSCSVATATASRCRATPGRRGARYSERPAADR